MREGSLGAGEVPERAACASPLAPRAALGSLNSWAKAVELTFGFGVRQAAGRHRAQAGGVENLQELGGFDSQPQLIPLQTWSCLLPRPPQGGGGRCCCSFPLPRPCRTAGLPLPARCRGGQQDPGVGGGLVCAPTRLVGGGLKGAVKVGNWENSLHVQNREKEMHQRAGRGAGGAPVSRDGGRGWRGGAPASGGAAMGLGAKDRSLECCGATPASTSRPRLFTIYSAGALCNRPGEDPWGGAVSSLPPTSGSKRTPASSCLPLVGRESLFPISDMDWMAFS